MESYCTDLVMDFIKGNSTAPEYKLVIIKQNQATKITVSSLGIRHDNFEKFINDVTNKGRKADITTDFNGSKVQGSINSLINKLPAESILCTQGEWERNKSKTTFLSVTKVK